MSNNKIFKRPILIMSLF